MSRTFVRPAAHGNHISVYLEVAEVGVLVVRATSDEIDPRGRLIPETLSLRSAKLLDRLEQDQTPLPPVDGDDATRNRE
jgi:hypothetical protein